MHLSNQYKIHLCVARVWQFQALALFALRNELLGPDAIPGPANPFKSLPERPQSFPLAPLCESLLADKGNSPGTYLR